MPVNARRFQTAAAHYLAGRPPYPARLIHDVALLCGLTKAGHVLDLGCGPGQLALGFASLVGSVLALDPEPEMLAICRRQVLAAKLDNVTVELGSSNDLDRYDAGGFKLVVIGRAFHWMDRADVLRQLDRLIVPGGAVVLFGDNHPDLPANRWLTEFKAVTEIYAGKDPARALRKSADWQANGEVLLASNFNQLERLSVLNDYHLSIDQVIDRALSRSSTSRQQLGDQTDKMIQALRDRLTALAPDGHLAELVETLALIARRPASGS